MITTKDKAGQTVYITYTNDCGENEGGFYCETYSDENCDHKIDDFCIYPEDIPGVDQMSYDERCNAIDDYCRHYYDDEVLDLNWEF
jgi:hypothetical protein